jgi:hypothetical protein
MRTLQVCSLVGVEEEEEVVEEKVEAAMRKKERGCG